MSALRTYRCVRGHTWPGGDVPGLCPVCLRPALPPAPAADAPGETAVEHLRNARQLVSNLKNGYAAGEISIAVADACVAIDARILKALVQLAKSADAVGRQ